MIAIAVRGFEQSSCTLVKVSFTSATSIVDIAEGTTIVAADTVTIGTSNSIQHNGSTGQGNWTVNGVGGAVAEFQEGFEVLPDASHVGGNLLGRQDRTRLLLVGWIADLGGAAAHQHDRLPAGLLEPAQVHDLHQAADVQRLRGGVEADITTRRACGGVLIEPLLVCELVDVAAADHFPQECRFGVCCVECHERGS
jgi:hypothetical protein